MTQLNSIALKNQALPNGFPFDLPLLANFERLEFAAPITFFVGENGSGKSTLLEALAAAANLPAIGGDDLERDETLNHARSLGKFLRLSWKKRTHRGFFLRAEDFFGFARRVNQMQGELAAQAAEYERELQENPRDAGLQRARGFILGQKRALEAKYGADADARSHGEGFLNLFEQRLVPGGLYLLDEPEAPLSPLRQLALLKILKDVVAQDCQFIIATHSPILMAAPDAQIFQFDERIRPIEWEETEHVALTKAFLNEPEAFLRRL